MIKNYQKKGSRDVVYSSFFLKKKESPHGLYKLYPTLGSNRTDQQEPTAYLS